MCKRIQNGWCWRRTRRSCRRDCGNGWKTGLSIVHELVLEGRVVVEESLGDFGEEIQRLCLGAFEDYSGLRWAVFSC
jgi:hypothetical protein